MRFDSISFKELLPLHPHQSQYRKNVEDHGAKCHNRKAVAVRMAQAR
jgi:hypothetical protein